MIGSKKYCLQALLGSPGYSCQRTQGHKASNDFPDTEGQYIDIPSPNYHEIINLLTITNPSLGVPHT